MNNRLCPSEKILSEYLGNALSVKDSAKTEEHLAGCTECRKLLAETHDILSRPDPGETIRAVFRWIGKNRWFFGAFISLIFSFLLRKYFLQFLAACLLMGGKWIIDSKTTRMLIMIHEAWKHGDKDKAGGLFKQFDHKN